MDFVHNFGPRRKKIHLSTRRKLKVLLALNSKSQKCLLSNIDSDCEHDVGKYLLTFLQCEQFHIERLRELMKVFMHPTLRENVECVDDLIGLVEEMLSIHGAVCAGLFSSASDSFNQLCLNAYVSYSLLIHLEKSRFQEIFGKHKDIFFDDELLQEPILYISKCKAVFEKLYLANPQEAYYYNTLKHVEMTWSDVKSQLFVRENTIRMLHIQRALFKREPKILSPGRILIKEGILHKVNQKGTNMKPKVFFLFNDALLCCKILGKKMSDEYERNSLIFSTLLPLKMCAVVLIMGSSKGGALFKVTCGTLSYLLLSKIPGEAQSWFEELQIAIRSSQKLHGELKLKLNRKTKVFKQPISAFSNQPL